jgi:hypothetical protein
VAFGSHIVEPMKFERRARFIAGSVVLFCVDNLRIRVVQRAALG